MTCRVLNVSVSKTQKCYNLTTESSSGLQLKYLCPQLPVSTWGVSVPSNGMDKTVFPGLIYFPQ